MRLGIAKDAGLVFGQVKARKGCVGGGFGVAAQASKGGGRDPRGGAVLGRGRGACWGEGPIGRCGAVGAGPGAGLEPVTFERLPGEPGG
jgi:hypothetical protein